jgi:hypothetical protein
MRAVTGRNRMMGSRSQWASSSSTDMVSTSRPLAASSATSQTLIADTAKVASRSAS